MNSGKRGNGTSRIVALVLALSYGLSASTGWAMFSRGGGQGEGVRAMGMGGAFVAVADDPSASYWNPAGGAQIRQLEIMGMYASLFNDKSRNSYIAVHVPTRDDIHITVSFSSLFYPQTSGAQEDTLLASVAIPLTQNRRLMFGTSFRLLYGELGVPGGIARGRGLDLGFLYLLPLPRNRQLRVGFAVTDLFTTLRFTDGLEQIIPRLYTPGVAFKFDPDTEISMDLGWTDTQSLSQEDKFRVRGGLEHWFFDRKWGIRAGFEKFTTLPGELTLGTSYESKRWSLDYAFMSHPQLLGNSHRIGASWKFDLPGISAPEEVFLTDLSGLVGDEKIQLNWTLPPKIRVDGYWIYYRAEDENEYHRRRPEFLETNYCVLRGAHNGVRYHVYVRLIVNGKQGEPSHEIVLTPRPILGEAKPFYDRGVVSLDSGDTETAMAQARQAEQLDPDNFDIKELLRRIVTARQEGLLKGEK